MIYQMIKTYPYQITTLQLYEDPAVASLQREVEALEQELVELQQLKAEIETQLQALSRRYRQELGHLLGELLRLRRSRLAHEAQPDEQPQADDEPAQAGAESYPATPMSEKFPELTQGEQQELKELFRKASKLCHPDLVTDEFRQEAKDTFIELKAAYEQSDLNRLREILDILAQGSMPLRKTPFISDRDKLYMRINYLRPKIKALLQEIAKLKDSQPYHRLVSLDDWDDYFDELKARLQREINRLTRHERKQKKRQYVRSM